MNINLFDQTWFIYSPNFPSCIKQMIDKIVSTQNFFVGDK